MCVCVCEVDVPAVGSDKKLPASFQGLVWCQYPKKGVSKDAPWKMDDWCNHREEFHWSTNQNHRHILTILGAQDLKTYENILVRQVM